MGWRWPWMPKTLPPSPKYELTAYWMPSFTCRKTWDIKFYRPKPGQPKTRVIRTPTGSANLPVAFLNAARMEGCAKISGRVLNYLGKGKWNWLNPARYPWGRGASGEKIVPFLSVAVDRTVLKLRCIYRIPQLSGLRLPGGRIHRGIVRASDTGGAIKGRRIDLHVGTLAQYRTMSKRFKFPAMVNLEEVKRT